MCLRLAVVCLGLVAPAVAGMNAASIPPGRQHRLTIEGENTVTFLPQAQREPVKVDYQARIEYIVDTRLGKEPKADPEAKPEAEARVEEPLVKKAVPGKGGTSARARARDLENPSMKVTGAVDLSLHSTEMTFRQNGQAILESRMSRSRFQGRLLPDAPVLNVSAREAPLRLQEHLKLFDTITASLLINDESRVVNRKIRTESPQRAVVETLLSIHAPIPRDAETWESPTQLAMGHGQTAKGKLRFETLKAGLNNTGDRVKVKVSGVLKAEGVVAGNLIKDGTYTVQGEQTYDTHAREWVAARWSVVVDNELANQAGLTVARAKGIMIVESRPVDAGETGSSVPKL